MLKRDLRKLDIGAEIARLREENAFLKTISKSVCLSCGAQFVPEQLCGGCRANVGSGAAIRMKAVLALEELADRAKNYEAMLREVADSGVEVDDARLDYVVVQVPREVWEAVRGLVGAKANKEG